MISKELITKYNKPGPRYTSYPPANFFTEEYSSLDYIEGVKSSNTQKPEAISIYIHIPFCIQRCHFCGCNTEFGRGKSFIERYTDAVIREIEMVAKMLDKSRKVTQIHWGGGTPNSIPYIFIEKISEKIKKHFTIADNAEIAMECSPAYLEFSHIDKLAQMGFNRISLGVQDFDDKVLEIVNRKGSKHPVKELISYCREKGFKGINLDLIYGLPMQTVDSFLDSVNKAIDADPDRIVTFSYAHVPWVKEAQKILEKVGLPQPEEKMQMLISSYNLLLQNGFVSIGMDHYAKPHDDIAIALKNKKLHRNFQGYCTLETTGQVYGFGSSSISQIYSGYSQNEKNVDKYLARIENGELPIERGYKLSEKEQIRKYTINQIMCNNYLDFDEAANKFNIKIKDFKEIIEFDEEKFKDFIDDRLLQIDKNRININDKGRLVVRNIAMALDPALSTSEMQYSKTV